MNRVDRLFGILLMLQSKQRVTALDIANRYEISERTVYRDMAALMQLGVPIVSQAGEGYALMDGYFLPPLVFTPAEAGALFLGVQMLAASGNLPVDATDAPHKLEAALPARTLRQITPLVKGITFYFEENPFTLNDPYLQALQQAIAEKRVLAVRYQGYKGDISQREIEPFQLTFSGRAWYVSAYCRLRQDIRSFRLERIAEMRALPQHFTAQHQPPSEAPRTVEVTVRFSPSVLRHVRERQHYGFVGEVPDGDAAIMTYRVHDLSEVSRWLFGWGAAAEVLAPQSLRDQLRDEARRLFDLLT